MAKQNKVKCRLCGRTRKQHSRYACQITHPFTKWARRIEGVVEVSVSPIASERNVKRIVTILKEMLNG